MITKYFPPLISDTNTKNYLFCPFRTILLSLLLLFTKVNLFSQSVSIFPAFTPYAVWKQDVIETWEFFSTNISTNGLPYIVRVSFQEDWISTIHLEEPVVKIYSASTGYRDLVRNPNNHLTWSVGIIPAMGPASIFITLKGKNQTPRCTPFHINAKFYLSDGVTLVASATQTVVPNPYCTPQSSNSERVAICSNSDLFIRDNLNDIGDEPFLTNPTATLIANQTNGINNRLFNNIGIFENPTRSNLTTPNPNYMQVQIINKSCQNTPSSELFMNWTIARFNEPWARDWRNFNRGTHYANNKVVFNGVDYPMGNEITISNPWNYSSNEVPITVSGLAPGGIVSMSSPWVVPDPVWAKFGTYTLGVGDYPIQFSKVNANPVICLLATLNEGWRTNNGYYAPAQPTDNVNIIEYANNNNNVATRNTYILNSSNGYKWSPINGNPRSRGGELIVNQPPGGSDPIDIGFIRNTTIYDSLGIPSFNDHGHINVYLDAFLWNKWATGGYQGTNISILEDQIIQITNPNFASIENITINEDEFGWIAIESEFYETTPPEEKYEYSFSIGSLDSLTGQLKGSPTKFIANVLSNPIILEDDDLGGFELTSAMESMKDKNRILNVYPNPAKDMITIDYKNSENIVQEINAKLFNVQGQLLKEMNTSISSKYSMSINDILPGVYFMVISTNNNYLQTFKIIKN